jgi:hypothetical protein
MKSITWALLLGWGVCGVAFGQASQSTPKPAPGFGGLFQFPTIPEGGKPQFKLQIPGNGAEAFALPETPLMVTPEHQAAPPADPRMVHRPKGFAQRQARPAQPHNIYPDLKVLPIEMAKIESPGEPGSQAGLIPIPRVWPKARIEPIPTTWQGYRMVPVTAPSDGKAAK